MNQPEITARYLLNQLAEMRETVLLLLAQSRPNDTEVRDTIPAIKERVARRFDVTVEAIDGRRKFSDLIRLRHIAIYLASQVQTTAGNRAFNNQQIARAFHRDHGAICHAIERVKFDMRKPEFAKVIEELQNQPERSAEK